MNFQEIADSGDYSLIQKTVDKYLADNDIKYSVGFTGTQLRWGDYRPSYRVKFNDQSFRFWNCVDDYNAPTASTILHALIMDLFAEDYTFEEWCDEFGYDIDELQCVIGYCGSYHIKDIEAWIEGNEWFEVDLSPLKTYQACLSNSEKVHKVFTTQQIENLRTLLSQY